MLSTELLKNLPQISLPQSILAWSYTVASPITCKHTVQMYTSRTGTDTTKTAKGPVCLPAINNIHLYCMATSNQ